MVRQSSAVLGIGLVVLWFAELSHDVAPWLTWLDLVAAITAFVITGTLA